MTKLYVVIGTSGEYSDRVWWCHCAYATMAEAEAEVAHQKALIAAMHAEHSRRVVPHGWTNMTTVRDDLDFSIEEVPFGPGMAPR